MNRLLLALCLFVAGLQGAIPAMAAQKLFPRATESDEQLKTLYDDAGDICLHNPSGDVRVAVACKAMTIYGVALNERDWCYGRRDEANAEMRWHRCKADSERFSLDTLTDFER